MRIDLLGTSFSVQTDESEEYFKEVVGLYARKIEEIRASVATSDSLKIAILAGILTADEYLKLSGKTRAQSMEVSKITNSLIGAIDDALTDDSEPLVDSDE